MIRKKLAVAWALALALTILVAVPARAHRVNIFAYVEGGEVVVECGFNRSQKVRQGKVEVRDAATDQLLLEGVTGDDGMFRFAIPAEARKSGHDLRVLVNAGEGHQNEWSIPASEFGEAMGRAAGSAISSSTAASTSGAASSATSASGAMGGQETGESTSASPKKSAAFDGMEKNAVPVQGGWATSADVERIVNAALETRLAPMKKMLAEQYESGPELKDIIGGIGWIFGLVGVAAYFRRRP